MGDVPARGLFFGGRCRAAGELSGDHAQNDENKSEASLLGGGIVEPASEADERLQDGDPKCEEEEADDQSGERAH